MKLKTVSNNEIQEVKKLSTEKLIIWIVGKAKELNLKLSSEDIVLECWTINPEKHSMRRFPQYPDSHTVMKRIGEMKGKKGLLSGSQMGGYDLTDISSLIYADLKVLTKLHKVIESKGHSAANRDLSSIEEAPYKRLKKTPAYVKFMDNRINEIVETDFLYFYGINWHSKKSFIINRIKNTDLIVEIFSKKDKCLKEVHKLLKDKYKYVEEKLLGQL